MCQQAPQRFQISIREIFSNSFSFRMIKKYDKGCHDDFTMAWDPLPCSLPKDVLKRRFLESGLTNFLTVSNLGNTLVISIIFFSENV